MFIIKKLNNIHWLTKKRLNATESCWVVNVISLGISSPGFDMFQRACRLEIEIRTLFTSGILGLHFRCKNVGTLVDASSTDLQFYVLWPCHSLRDTYSPGWYPVPFLFPFVSFDIVLFHNVAPEAKLCLSDRQSLIGILQNKVRVMWSFWYANLTAHRSTCQWKQVKSHVKGFLFEKLIPIFESGPLGYLPRASYNKCIYQRSWRSLDPLKLHIKLLNKG